MDLSLRLLDRHQAGRLASLSPALSAWSEGALPQLRSLWLEFDLDREAEGLPSPVVSARLAGEIDAVQLADAVLPALHGQPLAAAQRELVLSCCARLPPGAHLLYAFSLRARGTDAVRLEIGCPPDLAAPAIEAFAPDQAARVGRLAKLLHRAERFHLSFDIGAGISPRFGLEGSFARQPAREPGWRAVFDGLQGAGLSTAQQCAAVFAWPGSDSLWSAPRGWPVAEVGAAGHCVRSLSHVKLVSQPDREPEAKVYLALAYVSS